jgi:hypothetical protein
MLVGVTVYVLVSSPQPSKTARFSSSCSGSGKSVVLSGSPCCSYVGQGGERKPKCHKALVLALCLLTRDYRTMEKARGYPSLLELQSKKVMSWSSLVNEA